jgi:hypothetical protein
MKLAYFDCFSGAAGDMIMAAMLDAGCPIGVLHETVRALNLPGVTLCAERVKRHGIAATYVRVEVGPEAQKKHRHLHHIEKIIDEARLDATVATRARVIFRRLAEAEAAVHNTTIEKVHFHEVGAADAIVDIVGAAAGLHALGVERCVCSAVPTGHGTVNCEHGIIPVPAPATARLLIGVPLAACEEPGELTTPTGAAILTTLCDDFGPPPPLKIAAIGYGAGTREGKTRANVLRVMLGEPVDAATAAASAARHADREYADIVTILEAQLDDAPGQNVAFAAQRLLDAGALDVFVVPIIMKKGRPGQLISVLCRPADADALTARLFAETTTFGVRRTQAARAKLAREHTAVATPFGEIRVKVGRDANGQAVQAWPEYDDCCAAALRSGASLRDVQDAARQAWMQQNAGQRQ